MKKVTECETWLHGYLYRYGWSNYARVKAEAKALRFKKSELKQARRNLGVVTKTETLGDPPAVYCYWNLPENHRR